MTATETDARRTPRRRVARRTSLRTLRTRVTVVAGLALTATVVLGLVIMYLLQRESARRSVDGQLRTYATQVAQSAPDGAWPRPLPPSTLDPNEPAQVLAADGGVLAATRSLQGLPAVYTLPPGSDTPVRQKAAEGVIPAEIRVFALRTTVAGHQVTIITGASSGFLSQVNETFARLLLVGVPGILLLAAGTVWLVVGRALRPVEQIRQAVTEITGKVGNEGNRVLKLVEINCVFSDAYGQVVLRERVPIVSQKNGGLAPGEVKTFRLAFDNIPESWNQALPQLVIAQIVFA